MPESLSRGRAIRSFFYGEPIKNRCRQVQAFQELGMLSPFPSLSAILSFFFSLRLAFLFGTISNLAAFMARFIVGSTFNDPFYEWYIHSVIRGLRCFFDRDTVAIRSTRACQILNPLTPLRGEVNGSYYFSWQRFPLSSLLRSDREVHSVYVPTVNWVRTACRIF